MPTLHMPTFPLGPQARFSVVYQWHQVLFRCSFLTMPLIPCGSFHPCSILPIHFSPFLLFSSMMWIHPCPFCHASIFHCCFRLHCAIRGKEGKIDFPLCPGRIFCLRHSVNLPLKSILSKLHVGVLIMAQWKQTWLVPWGCRFDPWPCSEG